ncbi:hypothetical protein F5B22DRAFT_74838 [Xylaria bambusicola]|uniref:uncharacterized protein n=1 Tax=Xylaria bambusicola TaxID=326684 RepID=UPI00200865D2|nr:uncharacterized protein F5B22DRAFT_74838 [Xylaria bambusicola]KAI0518178.1 hypothetical protein F5B22DRAFT_74838 [Xylaria bambusicola]
MRMSILCCCRNHQSSEKKTQTEPLELPIQPPRARLSKTLSRSDTDMYLSSILASRGPSQLIIPAYHNIVDPEAVDVEDSDDEGPDRNTREPNMTALGSFRTKFIRRLSHRADSKACSGPSVGTSDEELARRAELKRLMHKRIQDELKSEEEEEEDEDNNMGLSPLKPPVINDCRESELPGGGPRDTIEFSVSAVDDQEPIKEIHTPSGTPFPSTPVITGPQESFQQRSHHSKSPKASIDNSCQEYNILNKVDSVVQPQSSPHLTPVHLLGGSGRGSPSTASWRLSYSEIHIESYIEPLVEARAASRPQSLLPERSLSKLDNNTTQASETDATSYYIKPAMQNGMIGTSQAMQTGQNTHLEEDSENRDISSDSFETTDGRYSPMDVWLRSQNVHCASDSSSCSDPEIGHESSNNCDITDRAAGQQYSGKSSSHSIFTEQTVASSSIVREHPPGAWPMTPEQITGNESIVSYHPSNLIHNVIDTASTPTEDQDQDVSSRYTSSRYTTRPNSQQAAPMDSHQSLTELLGNRQILQPLSSAQGSVSQYNVTDSENSGSSYRTALNKMPSSDHTKTDPEFTRVGMAEALSINASETESFRQREEELKSIEKRFGLTPARRYPRTPVRSKFREEFDDSKDSSIGKSSILSKLYLAIPKKSRMPSSHMGLNKSNEEIGMHLVDCRKSQKLQLSAIDSNQEHCLPSKTVPETQEEATGHRQRTKNQGADHHTGRLKGRLIKVSALKADLNSSEAQAIHPGTRCLDINTTTGKKSIGKDKARHPLPVPEDIGGTKDAEAGRTVGIHAGVFQEWVEQLQAEAVQRESQAQFRHNVPKDQPLRLHTPPASWAKWPSHTRRERTAAAGAKDRVIARDFAAVPSPDLSKPRTDNKQAMGPDLTETSRNISSQLGKALKSSWNKMMHTGSIGRTPDHGLTTQGSLMSHGFLEYPELKLLPTAESYREVQALDQQIDTMKRRSISGKRCVRQSGNDGARGPLASRIAEEVHKFQIGSENTPWTDIQHNTKFSTPTEFLSPAHALVRRSGPYNQEPFSSAGFQSAYEDCVQTQMLDEGDDNNIVEGQDRAIIKRAKSTGNIKIEQPEDGRNPTPIRKAMKMGLRRHKSLGWIRGRNNGSDKVLAGGLEQHSIGELNISTQTN